MSRENDKKKPGAEPWPIDCITADPVRGEVIATHAMTNGDEQTQGPAKNGGGGVALKDASLREIYGEILRRVDEDPTREGLLRTPERVERSMEFLTHGYRQTVDEVVGGALFEVDYDEMVIVRDIEFYSMCEHHMLPFFGKAHIAYVPHGKVVGLSKLPRIVDVFARRLQVQERLTQEISEAIEKAIHPQGVGVVIEAQHLCMMMRGVEKQSSLTVTSSMRGVFKTQLQTREEFLSLVRNRR